MKKVSGFTLIVEFFNSKKSNKLFTRAEYFRALDGHGIADTYLDTVRRYLCAAGYLSDFEPGAYRKVKPIPKDLTISKLERQAYPKAKRFNLKYQFVVYRQGFRPYTSKCFDTKTEAAAAFKQRLLETPTGDLGSRATGRVYSV